ncbi:unnamed protein product [Acanthoscelides obtectus]|uniref:Uncharacterized protein n=1 Tax=Acanthoscelides obtectus TaxID=200917 RepID=A0A9P0LGX3_ACAOB|nr:unnamed protein product [Acanthoscelides obtectus]CAK1667084.1 hypothetical protein AOBTE_LOCUS25673 [Acanthoscelides obtectus]
MVNTSLFRTLIMQEDALTVKDRMDQLFLEHGGILYKETLVSCNFKDFLDDHPK